jgi:catechol 2,3-dioxygenase-like lactoylglutathione lyase family enzyme
MTRLHHVNLGVLPDEADAEADFLVAVLGYRKVEPPLTTAKGFGARWYETDDGTQVHLSLDPGHRPAAQAHTALELSDQLDEVARRLRDAGIDYGDNEFNGSRVLLCEDPAGNRWELRGPTAP